MHTPREAEAEGEGEGESIKWKGDGLQVDPKKEADCVESCGPSKLLAPV